MPDTTDWGAVDALTDEEITSAALADPDAQPLPEGWLKRARRGPHPRFVRIKLGLSREEFATRYHIPRDLLAQWEVQKAWPDEIARAYLKAIVADSEGVARAVNATPQPQAAAE